MGSTHHPDEPPVGKPKAENDVRQQKAKGVGDALRRIYAEAAEEPVPEEMLDLLKKLT